MEEYERVFCLRCNGHLISRNEPDAPGEPHLTACHLCGASTCNSRQEKNN